MESLWIIGLHQVIFQAMFAFKNITLGKRIGKQIRGSNREVNVGIAFFTIFIFVSLVLSIVGDDHASSHAPTMAVGSILLCLNLAIAAASLVHLKESWRVGVLENQKTALITTGIYRLTRNPYFVSYGLMFLAYAMILQSVILLGLTPIGLYLIHKMILAEEHYLLSLHGQRYAAYQKRVPRYLLI